MEDQIDALFQMKKIHFAFLNNDDHLFYFDPNLDEECAQFQNLVRVKSREVQEKINRIEEEHRQMEERKALIQSFRDQMNVCQKNFKEISTERKRDDRSTFDRLTSFLHQIEQVQHQLKDLSKQLHRISSEEISSSLDEFRKSVDEEFLQINRWIQEAKSIEQISKHFDEFLPKRSELFDAKSSREKILQYNLHLNQIDEQISFIEHQRTFTSKYLEQRRDEFQRELDTFRKEIQSRIEREMQLIEMENQLNNIENEFDRRPIFNSILTEDSVRNYQKISEEFYRNLDKEIRRYEEMKEKSSDAKQFDPRWNSLKQRYEQMKDYQQTNLQHLEQGLNQEKDFEKKIEVVLKALHHCEEQLNHRSTMKESELKCEFQVNRKRFL